MSGGVDFFFRIEKKICKEEEEEEEKKIKGRGKRRK